MPQNHFLTGLVVAPTAIINGTPLDCNFCQKDHCRGASTTPAPAVPPPGDPRANETSPGPQVDDRGFILQVQFFCCFFQTKEKREMSSR